MAFAETKLALEAGTAGLTMVSQLVSVVKSLRAGDKKGSSDPAMSDLLARLPAIAVSISRDLLKEVEALRQQFVDRKIDTAKTIEELEREHWWWLSGSYNLVRDFHSRANALSDVAGHAIDDFIALARCRDNADAIVKAFEESKGLKVEIDSILGRTVPVRTMLEKMIAFARHLSDDVQKLAT